MGKRILATVAVHIIMFVLLALLYSLMGKDEWFMKTVMWIIPSAVGYFLGYGQAQRDGSL